MSGIERIGATVGALVLVAWSFAAPALPEEAPAAALEEETVEQEDETAEAGEGPVEAAAVCPGLGARTAGKAKVGGPGLNVHVFQDSDTPTLRLYQDGADGWGVQSWDLAGNEKAFSIKDATHDVEALRIEPKTGHAAVKSLTVCGDLTVAGTKSFAVPDPEEAGRWIYFAALEGPEAGTYYRGTARTEQGTAVIELPAYFEKVTEAEGRTVQVTPLGDWSRLYVAELAPGRLVVREAGGRDGIAFSYLVQGVRRGHSTFRVDRPALRGGG